MAEGEGFEPPDGCPSTVFKTAAFDRSANLPYVAIVSYSAVRVKNFLGMGPFIGLPKKIAKQDFLGNEGRSGRRMK